MEECKHLSRSSAIILGGMGVDILRGCMGMRYGYSKGNEVREVC